jgi:hypothetical protein
LNRIAAPRAGLRIQSLDYSNPGIALTHIFLCESSFYARAGKSSPLTSFTASFWFWPRKCRVICGGSRKQWAQHLRTAPLIAVTSDARLKKAMESFFKRWIVVGMSIAFVVLAVRRVGDELDVRR